MTDEPMSVSGGKSVGTILRESRDKRSLTLEDAARATRIGKNYLEALEDDAFHKLPSLAYVKGFLRVYAGYLGLSPDETVSRYDEWLQATAPPEQEPMEGLSAPRQERTVSIPNRWTIPFILMALVLVMAYVVGERDHGPQHQDQPRPATMAVAPPAPVQNIVSSSASTRLHLTPAGAPDPVQPPGRETFSSPVAGEGIVLRLKVNQDCLLNITIDGTLSQQYELKAGDLIEWKGEKVFSLDLGNAGGVEAEFNGKILPPFGEDGAPAHVVLKAEEADE